MWTIPRPLLNKMFGHAQRALPRECVGLLSGVGQQASHWHPLVNVAVGEADYLADAGGHIAAFRAMRDEGRQLVAIYHSHPHGSVQPSAKDVAQSYYPESLHLIIAMNTEGCLEMAGYLFAQDQVTPQEICICE